MDKILEIHGGLFTWVLRRMACSLPPYFIFPEADSDLVCQPGAHWMDINERLRERGEQGPSPLSRNTTKQIVRYPFILSGKAPLLIRRWRFNY